MKECLLIRINKCGYPDELIRIMAAEKKLVQPLLLFNEYALLFLE